MPPSCSLSSPERIARSPSWSTEPRSFCSEGGFWAISSSTKRRSSPARRRRARRRSRTEMHRIVLRRSYCRSSGGSMSLPTGVSSAPSVPVAAADSGPVLLGPDLSRPPSAPQKQHNLGEVERGTVCWRTRKSPDEPARLDSNRRSALPQEGLVQETPVTLPSLDGCPFQEVLPGDTSAE